MRLIKGPTQLPYPPRACAVTGRIDGDFIDLNTVIDSPQPTRLYLKREIAESAAELCGMVKGERVKELERDLEALGEQIKDMQKKTTATADFEAAFSERTPAHA